MGWRASGGMKGGGGKETEGHYFLGQGRAHADWPSDQSRKEVEGVAAREPCDAREKGGGQSGIRRIHSHPLINSPERVWRHNTFHFTGSLGGERRCDDRDQWHRRSCQPANNFFPLLEVQCGFGDLKVTELRTATFSKIARGNLSIFTWLDHLPKPVIIDYN